MDLAVIVWSDIRLFLLGKGGEAEVIPPDIELPLFRQLVQEDVVHGGLGEGSDPMLLEFPLGDGLIGEAISPLAAPHIGGEEVEEPSNRIIGKLHPAPRRIGNLEA